MDQVHQETGLWWLFLITGILWVLVSLVVLQFEAKSVATVGKDELTRLTSIMRHWKWRDLKVTDLKWLMTTKDVELW